jgi:hypothetical protein
MEWESERLRPGTGGLPVLCVLENAWEKKAEETS